MSIAGDEATWNLHDWNWDSQNFIATPKKGVVVGAEHCRAVKRSRIEGPSCSGPCVPGTVLFSDSP